MSAYQVGTDLIDLIVSAALETDYHGETHRRSISVFVRPGRVIYTDAARACFTVTDGGIPWGRLEIRNGTILGRELIAANIASVALRYPSDTRTNRIGGMVGYLPDSYTYRRVSRDRFADLGHVFGALACYEYQSCETGEDTLAELITDQVRRDIARRVYEMTADSGDGFRSWDWSRRDADEARQAIRARTLASLRK